MPRRELGEGQSAAALLSVPTIRPCLALFNFLFNKFTTAVSPSGAPSSSFGPLHLRLHQNRPSFISRPTHLQSWLPIRSYKIDHDSFALRFQYQSLDAVSMASFCRRHHLDRSALFLQSR